jgi:hypothetical protein
LNGRRLLDLLLGSAGSGSGLGRGGRSRLGSSLAGGTGLVGAGATTVEHRESAVVVADAAGDCDDLLGALDLLELNVGVVGVLEPVKAPLATILEKFGHGVALGAGRDTAISLSREELAKLGGAAVEDAKA